MATSKCVSALLQRTSSRSGTWIETKSTRPRGGTGYSTTTRSSTPLLPPRSISASAAAQRRGNRLVDWIERRPADPHLTLHLANLEAESPDSDQTRLELFNDVLRAGNAAPVVSSEPMPHPLHLRVDRTALIDRADGPLVTVIMPAFNAQETIAAALGSLLAQTHRQLQIIVVDDASSDATVAIAETLAAQDNRISVIALRPATVARTPHGIPASNGLLAHSSPSMMPMIGLTLSASSAKSDTLRAPRPCRPTQPTGCVPTPR